MNDNRSRMPVMNVLFVQNVHVGISPDDQVDNGFSEKSEKKTG